MPEPMARTPGFENSLRAVSATVEARLAAHGVQPRALSGLELEAYPGRWFVAGWRLSVEFPDTLRRIDLLLPRGFPWKPPRVALVDRPSFLSWPHVESDGLLCLALESLEVDPLDPAGAATHLVGLACELVEELARGKCDNDFKDEFLSYWGFASNHLGAQLISLLEPRPPCRGVKLWRGKNLHVIAEDQNTLEAWLANRFGATPPSFKAENALFAWIGDPLLPHEYPTTAQALRDLVVKAGRGGLIFDDLAMPERDRFVTVLGFETANGPALAAVIVTSSGERSRGIRAPLTRGFRPGTIPKKVFATRYFGSAKVSRASIDRADAKWIHGRAQDTRANQLRNRTVGIVGCGSIGAPVAIALIEAGVGRIVLIDFDVLKWPNIGRHPLGASSVGQLKSQALAARLRSDFPHTTIEYHAADLDTVLDTNPDLLPSCDVIVSATGRWAADARLDAWHSASRPKTQIVYAWTEAHACAGHAVLIGRSTGCLQCGFDRTGLPLLSVSRWPEGMTQRQEPACGAVFQPYGPVELGFINSLVADLALEATLGEITGSTHRIWVGSSSRLARLGGQWTPEWQRIAAGRSEGRFVLERAWPTVACSRCAKSIAA